MKSKRLLLLLLMALLVPWAAQAQETLTVCNGTETNEYLPVYGYYVDTQGTTSEFIIPANTEGMSDMEGGTISKLTFYISGSPTSWANPTIQLYLGEVEGTTLSSVNGPSNFTVVKTMEWSNQQSTIEVEFDVPYTYGGGNLLIGTYVASRGNYKHTYFFGVSAPSGSGYCHYSSYNASQSFLPKTTFTYEPAAQTDCEKPETVTTSQITQNSAMLNWEGGSTPGNGYNVELKGGQYDDWTRVFTHASQGVMLTQLVENTAYQVRVQTVCSLPSDQEEDVSVWKTASFNTPAYFSNFKAEIIPGQGTKATFSWTANGNPTEWQLCINGDEENLITMTENPFTYEGFTPEQTYTAKMRAFVGDNTGAWSNTETFTPTDSYLVTLNDGEDVNTYVPVHGSYCDYGNRSQFIIPAADLTAMQWGTLSELTFYSSNEIADTYFTNVVFKVYLAEVSKTTFETAEFFDWSNLNEVYNGSLVWSGKEWVFDIEDTYTYKGGNLLIGLHQTEWTSSYTTINWLGVNQPSGSNTAVSQYANSSHSWTINAIQFRAFLPKVTIKYIPGEEPDCLPVSGLTLGEITANSAKLGWTASASGETHWKLQYRESGTSEWNTVEVAESDLVQGFYHLQGLADNTRYNWQVAAWCGYPEDEPISDYVSGDDFDTPCLPIATLPLETFDDYEGSTSYSINNLPDCWNYINTCTYSYYSGTPNIYNSSSYAYSGTNSLHFYSYSSYPAENYAILPVMENLDGMRIKFYARYYNYNTNLIVGTMTNPKDATTFEPLDNGTISDLTTTYKPYKLNLTGASGKYIALKIAGTSSNSPHVYVDNILVEAIPDCEENEGLAVVANSVGKRAASFSWTAPDGQNAWQIGFSLTNSTEDITYTADVDNPDGSEVTGLEPGTTYYAWVRGNCTASEHGYSVWSSEYVTFTTDVACPVPATPVVDEENIEEESALMTWVAGGEETAWNIQLATYDASTETWSEYEMIEENYQSTSYTIGSLTQAHTYRVRVQAICGGEDGVSDWSDYAEFNTKASCFTPENFELTEDSETASGATVTWEGKSDHYVVEYREAATLLNDDFEKYSSGLPTNWQKVGSGTVAISSYSATHIHSGTKSMRFSGATSNVVALPEFGFEANQLKISFYTKAESGTNSSCGKFEVGYLTNVNDASTFVRVGEQLDYSDYGSYQLISNVSMAGAPDGARIAFRHLPTNTNWYWFVDDVVVERIVVDPWTVADNNVTDLTYTFNQLDDNTTYEVRVKGVCTSGESQYSDAVTFTTLDGCPAPTNFTLGEVTENSGSFSWTQPTNGVEINEWVVKYRKSGETEYLTLTPNPTTPSATIEGLDASTEYEVVIAPACNEENTLEDSFNTECAIHTLPYTYGFEDAAEFDCWTMTDCNSSSGIYSSANHSGNKCFYFYYEANSQQCLISPEFNCTTEMGVSFYYKNSSNSYDETFHVGYSTTTNDVDAFEWGDEIFVDKTNTSWLVYTNIFPVGTKFVAIKHTSDDAFYLYLDDFTFAEPISLTKEIEPYTGEKDNYYLIASPLAYDVDPTTIEGMTEVDYDLYYFDQTQNLEWRNHKDTEVGGYKLINGKGYLYANNTGNDITFAGVPYVGNGTVTLTKTENAEWSGWNLVGNPFSTTATIERGFYRMNEETGDEIIPGSGEINVMEGVFVEAESNGETMTFTGVVEVNNDQVMAINLNMDNILLDRAMVYFGGERKLSKFQLNPNHTKVYIPMESKDYAVINAESNVGEIPVSFKAEKNGSYTLSFTSKEVSFSYLHLIDNMTGADVNLLETPSYSFNAQTTDYESRFRLVFATGSSIDGDNFGFINGMGNLCIFGIDGTATVQVVDVTGRMLSSETFSGSYERKLNVAPGVYMIRLINGNDVKVQKMIVK